MYQRYHIGIQMVSYLTGGSPFKLPLGPFDTSPSFFELFLAFRHKIQVHLVPSLPQALHQPFLLGALFSYIIITGKRYLETKILDMFIDTVVSLP